MILKAFVPSRVCLKCDGCCRYKEADSIWRPAGGIKTIQTCERHFCEFFNGKDNTCGIYAKRPFECALYPFILSQTPDAVKVYVHLACPYVQDHLPRADYVAHVAYLKEFFRRGDIREFLSRNKSMFHDYSVYAVELLYLFDLADV